MAKGPPAHFRHLRLVLAQLATLVPSGNASNRILQISRTTPARPILRPRQPRLERFQNRTDHALQNADRRRANSLMSVVKDFGRSAASEQRDSRRTGVEM